jgi:hypothetical protein
MVQPALAALGGTGSTPITEFATPIAIDAEQPVAQRRAGLRIGVVLALVAAVASSLTPSADAAAGVTARVTGSATGDGVAVLPIAAETASRGAGDDSVGSAAPTGPVVTVVCAAGPGGDGMYGTSDDIVAAPRSAVADGAGRFSLDLPAELGTRLDGGRVAVSAGVACWRSVTPAAAQATGPLAIRDTVWHDTDLDGAFDPGEPVVADAVVTLLRADSIEERVAVRRARTDWAGRFEFAALPAGDYAIAISDLPSGLVAADVLGRSTVFHLDPGTGTGSAAAEVPGLALVATSAVRGADSGPAGGVVRWLPAVRSADLAPDQRSEQPAVRWLVPLMTLLLAMPLLAGLVTVPAWTRRRRGGPGGRTRRPDREPLPLPLSLDRRPRHLWR